MNETGEALVYLAKRLGIAARSLRKAMNEAAARYRQPGESPDQALSRAVTGPNSRIKGGADLLRACVELEQMEKLGGDGLPFRFTEDTLSGPPVATPMRGDETSHSNAGNYGSNSRVLSPISGGFVESDDGADPLTRWNAEVQRRMRENGLNYTQAHDAAVKAAMQDESLGGLWQAAKNHKLTSGAAGPTF